MHRPQCLIRIGLPDVQASWAQSVKKENHSKTFIHEKNKRGRQHKKLLHCFLKQDQDLNVDYLKILLNQKDENLDQQIKSIINKKDINGQTALHIAAQRQEQIN